MNIFVAGGGRVGFHLARLLSLENHDVTVVESDPSRAEQVDYALDVSTVVGNAGSVLLLKQAGADPERLIALVLAHTGLEMTIDEARKTLVRDEQGFAGRKDSTHYYGGPENSASALLGRVLSRHTYVVWSTGAHTSNLVPTYGRGPGAEKLRGIYLNTHIYSVMRETLETGP